MSQMSDSGLESLKFTKPTPMRMLGVLNMDEMFLQNPRAFVLNKDNQGGERFTEELENFLSFESSDDNESGFVATCECGAFRGNYYLNTYCPICRTEVSVGLASKIDHQAWLEIPKEFGMVLHPVFSMVLEDWLGKYRSKVDGPPSKTSILRMLLDPTMDVIPELQYLIRDQGFEYFHDNFDLIMDELMNNYTPTARKTEKVNYTKEFIRKYRDRLFCRYLPVLNSLLHPMKTGGSTLRFMDPTAKDLLKAAINLKDAIFNHRHRTSSRTKYKRVMYVMYTAYTAYIDSIIREKLNCKKSIVRMHVFGSRLHYSARAVITPHIGLHEADELSNPWPIMVNALKHDILNRLTRRWGLSMKEAVARQAKALTNYDEIIHTTMNDMIRESPFKGLPVILNRNPSLRHGASLELFVTKIKIQTTLDQYGFVQPVFDNTFSLSPMILSAPNADFDGDDLNMWFIRENSMVEAFKAMHPMHLVLDKGKPKVSTNVTLSDQSAIRMNSWIEEGKDLDNVRTNMAIRSMQDLQKLRAA